MTIESNIPIPYIRGTYTEMFTQMRDGQSFKVDDNNHREAALMAGRRAGHVVTSQKLENGSGFRVWLVKRKSTRSTALKTIAAVRRKQ